MVECSSCSLQDFFSHEHVSLNLSKLGFRSLVSTKFKAPRHSAALHFKYGLVGNDPNMHKVNLLNSHVNACIHATAAAGAAAAAAIIVAVARVVEVVGVAVVIVVVVVAVVVGVVIGVVGGVRVVGVVGVVVVV